MDSHALKKIWTRTVQKRGPLMMLANLLLEDRICRLKTITLETTKLVTDTYNIFSQLFISIIVQLSSYPRV